MKISRFFRRHKKVPHFASMRGLLPLVASLEIFFTEANTERAQKY